MSKKLAPIAATLAAAFWLPLTAHAQNSQTYNGNGGTGFSGYLGNGNLTVSSDGSGNITFSLAPSGGNFGGNDAVLYIDSKAGGFMNTATFTDNGDGGREAISGFNAVNNTRTLANFAPGFAADYALSFQDGFVGLFDLTPVGAGSFNFVAGSGQTGTSPFTVTVTAAQLGLQNGQSFNFVGTLISTNAYRSNEAIGTSTTAPGTTGDTPNAGFTGSTTFTTFDTFSPAPVPEPGGMVPMLLGTALLGGVVVARRRRGLAT